jgi:hypothetical protein
MKKLRIAIVAILALALILVSTHLVLSVNWPELLRSLHGR